MPAYRDTLDRAASILSRPSTTAAATSALYYWLLSKAKPLRHAKLTRHRAWHRYLPCRELFDDARIAT